MDPDKTQRLTGTEAQEAQEPQPQPCSPQPRKPQVGDTLLFHMGLDEMRPFIACAFAPGDRVTGLLIFAYEEDRHLPWVSRFSKLSPHVTQPTIWATAYHGWGVGEWHFPGEPRQLEEGESR